MAIKSKPETTVKQLMRDAMKALGLTTVTKGQRVTWKSEQPGDDCHVEFWGGSNFTTSGEVTLDSPSLGRWVANLNGGQRIGKPWQRRTASEVQAHREEQ